MKMIIVLASACAAFSSFAYAVESVNLDVEYSLKQTVDGKQMNRSGKTHVRVDYGVPAVLSGLNISANADENGKIKNSFIEVAILADKMPNDLANLKFGVTEYSNEKVDNVTNVRFISKLDEKASISGGGEGTSVTLTVTASEK